MDTLIYVIGALASIPLSIIGLLIALMLLWVVLTVVLGSLVELYYSLRGSD